MPFRDDAEALRSRVEVLEADLRRTKKDLDRARKDASEASALRAALLEIEAQLAEVRGERVNPRAQRTAAMALASGMALVVVGAMVARSTITHVPLPMPRRAAPSHVAPVMLPPGPSTPGASTFGPRLLTAVVDDAIGYAPVPQNTRCSVLISPTDVDGLQCRLNVTCGNRLVYGGQNQGYLPCVVRDGAPTTGVDSIGMQGDGDAMLDMDLTANRIIVSNDQPSVWRLDLEVSPAGLDPD